MEVRQHTYESPYGPMRLIDVDGAIAMCDWAASDRHKWNYHRLLEQLEALAKKRREPFNKADGSTPVIETTQRQLEDYFAGRRKEIDVPLMMVDTQFRQDVWRALRAIPYGAMCSYRDAMLAMGRAHGVRSVATAIGRNPLSVIVPCHRVVHADGTLSGYSGGADIKDKLLAMEAVNSGKEPPVWVPETEKTRQRRQRNW